MAEYSPMMRQYFAVKERNKDKIVFFRMGDFYEMFFDDAILASKELDLTLTGRECGQEERAPMCGVPHHSVDGYIARLIQKGYKVAICEQTEDPATAKGLVNREVIRVVTPGTVLEPDLLQDDRNNFIASICVAGPQAGICFADVSTGVAHTTLLNAANLNEAIVAELARFSPSEVLLNSEILKHKPVTEYIKKQLHCTVEMLDDEEYSAAAAKERLAAQFGAGLQAAVAASPDAPDFWALGALYGYLADTQKHGLERLKTVLPYGETQYMKLSPVTRANLEITETMRGREKRGTLLWVLDATGTNMGKRLLRLWLEQPLMDAETIGDRLDTVQELHDNNVTRLELREALSQIFDIERLMTRIVYGTATPREVAALSATCKRLPGILALLGPFRSSMLKNIRSGIDPLQDVTQAIDTALVDEPPALLKDGGIIRAGYNAEVDELRDIVHGGKGLLTGIEARLKEETGIRTLKIGYNRVFGYYIEVSKSFVDQVPEGFIRKQTLAGGERYITEELKELENRILGAGERLIVLERQMFADLLLRISEELSRIQRTALCVAQLDVLAGLAEVAVENNYARPQVNTGDALDIVEGRHPVVEQVQKGAPFVPNDTKLDCGDNRMQIITGPNMAGKSTYMRQTALICLMAQVGSFVPAKQASVGVCDAIFTRVGASDDLSQGQSTFMVEMTEVAEILHHATAKSLVVLDEIGRGTSTFDGMSIAQAVVEHMASPDSGPGCKTMFATHYHELTDLENAIDGVKNYNIAVKKRGDDITFLRRIVRGPADDSYGIQVAKLAGLPDEVTERAKQVLRVLEASANKTNPVTQLDFETFGSLQKVDAPAELVEKLRQVDPETLTPIEALNLVFELKRELAKE